MTPDPASRKAASPLLTAGTYQNSNFDAAAESPSRCWLRRGALSSDRERIVCMGSAVSNWKLNKMLRWSEMPQPERKQFHPRRQAARSPGVLVLIFTDLRAFLMRVVRDFVPCSFFDADYFGFSPLLLITQGPGRPKILRIETSCLPPLNHAFLTAISRAVSSVWVDSRASGRSGCRQGRFAV